MIAISGDYQYQLDNTHKSCGSFSPMSIEWIHALRGRWVCHGGLSASLTTGLFGWLVADGWCWSLLREEYCWLVVAGCWWLVRSTTHE
jgi:hypothetical protein